MQHFQPITDPLAGINLIEASAGTGKTYTISTLFVRLVVEQYRAVAQILVVTFTDAATEELRERIRQHLRLAKQLFEQQNASDADPLLSQWVQQYRQHKPDEIPSAIERLNNALRGFDESSVFTIHGFCRRMLQEQAFESGVLFDAELIKSQRALLNDIVADFWRQNFYHNDVLFIDYALAHKIDPERLQKLLNNYLHHEFLHIIPQVTIDENKVKQAVKRYQQTLQQVKQTWRDDSETLKDLFLNHPSLNRRNYNKKTIATLLSALDGYLNADHLSLDIPKDFKKLGSVFMVSAIKKGKVAPHHEFIDQCQALLDQHQTLDDLYHQRLIALKQKLFSEARIALTARKLHDNCMSFDDLLSHLHRALNGNSGEHLARIIRQKYPVALIDEFQDTDPLQYAIFRKIYYQAPDIVLFLIGDPKQAIYSFRGADIFTYLKAVNDADHQYTLGFNWRSSPQLIHAINHLFSYPQRPFLLDNLNFHPVQPADKSDDNPLAIAFADQPLRFWFANPVDMDAGKTISKELAQKHIPDWIAEEIIYLLAKHPTLQAGDIAILTRTNLQTQQLQKVLRLRGIPSVLFSKESLFDSFEAMEMQRLLEAIVDPYDETALKSALTTDMLGVDGVQLQQLLNDESTWSQWLLRFRDYHSLWKRQGFIQMFRTLLQQENIAQRLLLFADGERRLTNVLHLSEVLQQAALSPRRGMKRLTYWLAVQCQQTDDDVHQLRLESDDNAVKLVTVHKSKGLEYPVVFAPYAWNGKLGSQKSDEFVFHHPDNQQLTLDLGTPEQEQNRAYARAEELAENLRLLYVAVTRAKYCCYLLWGMFNESQNAVLGYLLHQQTEALQHELVSEYLKKADVSAWMNDLNRFQTAFPAGVRVSPPPVISHEKYQKPDEISFDLTAREFTGKLDAHWQITSFSHLVATDERLEIDSNPVLKEVLQLEMADRDWRKSKTTINSTEKNIFTFPAGAKAGLFFHDLLEHCDFKQPLSLESIQKYLINHGFDPEWDEVILTWLNDCLNTPLNETGLKLTDIPSRQRLNELEFHFPIQALNHDHFQQQLQQHYPMPENNPVLSGYLKGFIDLVFEHAGQYYIVDYKSNHLGFVHQDYQNPQMLEAIQQHHYSLQYLLYTLALHQYLSLRLPDYDYERDFGGVYYLFLRGMSPKSEINSGIFYDKPDLKFIEGLFEKY